MCGCCTYIQCDGKIVDKLKELKMTSKSCTKSCHRKLNNSTTSGNIQFDKLFKDNSNRPSAAKSAGTVGKWGVTSFTSIRSTNINGRRSLDSRSNHGIKRMKSDHGNQNVLEKNLLLLKKEESKSESYKPKKFFKSRNALTLSDDSQVNAGVRTPFSDPGRNQFCDEKQFSNISINDKARKNDKALKLLPESCCKDEGKPPIVLRICKGTAKFVCSEDNDSQTFRVSKNTTDSEVSTVGRDVKFIDKKSHVRDHGLLTIPTVSQSMESLDMRTTRSKAKNLRLDMPLNKPMLSNTAHNTGLSLTLRKSDSNDKDISHYDIVKTERSMSYSKIAHLSKSQLTLTTENLAGVSTAVFEIDKTKITEENQCEEIPGCVDRVFSIEKTSADVDIKSKFDVTSESGNLMNTHSNDEYADKALISAKSDHQRSIGDGIKNIDQDWGSSDDDNENANSNLNREIPNESQCSVSSFEIPLGITDKIADKPLGMRKASIFKTRSAGIINGNKRRAVYKHKWSDSDKDQKSLNSTINKANAIMESDTANDEINSCGNEFDNAQLTRIVSHSETGVFMPDNLENTISSIRCDRKTKGFYTVVKNVKKAHQIQESGEFQEFNDDIDYILDTLRDNNPNATRCLSAIRLASKCMAPAFRMHVRAHGTVAKFFKALHDATNDQSLALCTATVMFVLSQDRLAMDLDRDCLELMLSLLECDVSHRNALDDCGLSHSELQKNKEKVRQLCADIQAQGHAKHLNLDNITVGQLAMETLLSLTSKRAGEWFKEELRELGGLEHIIKTITDCYRHIDSHGVTLNGWNESLLDQLRKVDRCLRVLENVTHMNDENQVYLLRYNRSVLVNTMANMYKLCCLEVIKYPTNKYLNKDSVGTVIGECLLAIVKVFINLTHRFKAESCGDKIIGSRETVISNTLQLILQIPASLSEDKQFDVMMLALILLINLIEKSEDNRKSLIDSNVYSSKKENSSIGALINLFYAQEGLALAEEEKTDAILDGKKDSEQSEVSVVTPKTQEEFIEETVSKLLQKAGRHMEHTFIGAYVVLLLGYLILDNRAYEELVRQSLPNGTFSRMIAVLQKFFNFMNLTASNEISNCGIAATEKILKFLRNLDVDFIEEEKSSKIILDHV